MCTDERTEKIGEIFHLRTFQKEKRVSVESHVFRLSTSLIEKFLTEMIKSQMLKITDAKMTVAHLRNIDTEISTRKWIVKALDDNTKTGRFRINETFISHSERCVL